MGNVIAALGHSNRVCKVQLGAFKSFFFRAPTTARDRKLLDEVLAAMHVPFPELTDLLRVCDTSR